MKKFLLFLMAIGMFALASCGTDTTPNGPKPVTPIDLTNNPFSLLGVYEVTTYGKNEEPNSTPSQKSELRVGLNMSNSASGNPEVLMSLDFEGNKMVFDNYTIDLSKMGNDLNAFIAKTFAGLGAELIENDNTSLYFKLEPAKNPQYKAIIDNAIITDGQFLKLKLKKIQDLESDKDLEGNDIKAPEKPKEPVDVTGIKITTDPNKKYPKGFTVTIDFELTPLNTTNVKVKWSNIKGDKTGEITAINGKGSLVLTNVQQEDTITFTTEKNQTATYKIVVTESIESISFRNSSYVLKQGETKTIQIENHEAIASVGTLTYSVEGSDNIVQVNDKTGEITGLKNGIETLVATLTIGGKEPLTAKCKIDVLGNINYSDASSLEGTYDIVFFATNTNVEDTWTDVSSGVISNNCDYYDAFKWQVKTKCGEGTGGYKIPADDFAGKAIIKNDSGSLIVHTKVAFVGNKTIQNMAKDEQYQYTIYDKKVLNNWTSTSNTGTMSGRNVTSTTNLTNGVKYYFEQGNFSYAGKTGLDIVLFSHFDGKSTPVGNVNPDTRLILRKVSSEVKQMDPNSLTEAPFDRVKNKLTLENGGNITAPIQ